VAGGRLAIARDPRPFATNRPSASRATRLFQHRRAEMTTPEISGAESADSMNPLLGRPISGHVKRNGAGLYVRFGCRDLTVPETHPLPGYFITPAGARLSTSAGERS